jgi:hypothetical protein
MANETIRLRGRVACRIFRLHHIIAKNYGRRPLAGGVFTRGHGLGRRRFAADGGRERLAQRQMISPLSERTEWRA